MRGLRARYGLTLKEMSARTGLPFSTLSKVEHDRLTLTYDKLLAVAEKLNLPLSEFFAGPVESATQAANGRRSIATVDSALSVTTRNYDYFYMSPELRNKEMIPIFSRLKAKSIEAFGELVRHEGEEFLYVVEGEVVVHTEFYAPVTLRAREAVYIDSKMAHAYVVGQGFDEALAICVCSTSQEALIEVATREDVVGLAVDNAPPRPVTAKRTVSAGRMRASKKGV